MGDKGSKRSLRTCFSLYGLCWPIYISLVLLCRFNDIITITTPIMYLSFQTTPRPPCFFAVTVSSRRSGKKLTQNTLNLAPTLIEFLLSNDQRCDLLYVLQRGDPLFACNRATRPDKLYISCFVLCINYQNCRISSTIEYTLLLDRKRKTEMEIVTPLLSGTWMELCTIIWHLFMWGALL